MKAHPLLNTPSPLQLQDKSDLPVAFSCTIGDILLSRAETIFAGKNIVFCIYKASIFKNIINFVHLAIRILYPVHRAIRILYPVHLALRIYSSLAVWQFSRFARLSVLCDIKMLNTHSDVKCTLHGYVISRSIPPDNCHWPRAYNPF